MKKIIFLIIAITSPSDYSYKHQALFPQCSVLKTALPTFCTITVANITALPDKKKNAYFPITSITQSRQRLSRRSCLAANRDARICLERRIGRRVGVGGGEGRRCLAFHERVNSRRIAPRRSKQETRAIPRLHSRQVGVCLAVCALFLCSTV